ISQEIGDCSKQDTHSATNKLKSKVSATANNLITACKNFAASNGLLPISLVDAAASHLSTAMVDLIRVVKVRPSPAGELEDEEEENNSIIAESPAAYYGLQHERISYGGESIYSSPSSPQQANGPGGYAVQAKNSYHGRNHSSRNGMTNGVKATTHTKLGFGIRELDDEYDERH
ncbi:MAG: hypothetical protein Q9198_008098, partial [Flavoplaca austrocitrina]